MISQSIQKQSSMELSTIEAKYIASSDASREVVWLQKLLASLFDQELETTVIYFDNQSCVNILENLLLHDW